MARTRLVSQKICWSERVNALPGEGPLLYTWMITHTDKYGRMKALPLLIKNTVFPLRQVTLKNIKFWLKCMEDSKKNGVGLIEMYKVEGKEYLYMPGFDSEQAPKGGSTWRDREKIDSGIPAPPDWIPDSDEIPQVETGKDKKLAEVAQCYEDNIGSITPIIAESIKDLYKTYGLNRCMDAFREAAKHNVHKISYITAILEGRGKKPTKVTGKGNPFGDRVTE